MKYLLVLFVVFMCFGCMGESKCSEWEVEECAPGHNMYTAHIWIRNCQMKQQYSEKDCDKMWRGYCVIRKCEQGLSKWYETKYHGTTPYLDKPKPLGIQKWGKGAK